MNDPTHSANENQKILPAEQLAKIEICDECRNKCDQLDHEIDRQTLRSDLPSERLAYINAHLSKIGLTANPDAANLLLQYETQRKITSPDFGISTLSYKRIERILERDKNTRFARQTAADREQVVDDKLSSEAEYENRITALKTAGKSNVEIIQLLVNDPATPKNERIKLASFVELIALTEAPEDQALITEKLNTVEIAGLPAPRAFIAMQVFDGAAYKSGFSEVFQNKVAKAYGIAKPIKVVAHSDVRKLAQHKVVHTDPATGEVVERYKYDSDENMAEFRPGVGTYMDGERVMLKSIAGNVTKDVSGFSDTDIGLLAEAMGFYAMTEHFGATGFIETLGRINFSGLGSDAFSPSKVVQVRQIISALVGGFEGYDGDVFDAREKMGLIRVQMELLSPNGDTSGWSRDESDVQALLEGIGLHTNGKPNFDRIKLFGKLTQKNYMSGKIDRHTLNEELDRLS